MPALSLGVLEAKTAELANYIVYTDNRSVFVLRDDNSMIVKENELADLIRQFPDHNWLPGATAVEIWVQEGNSRLADSWIWGYAQSEKDAQDFDISYEDWWCEPLYKEEK